MRGQESQSLQTLDLIDGPEEVGQARLVGEIVAIGVDRLTEQSDLAHAGRDNAFDLAHDLVHRAAPLLAAPVGHDAVGAEEVAPVDDRHVRGNARCAA